MIPLNASACSTIESIMFSLTSQAPACPECAVRMDAVTSLRYTSPDVPCQLGISLVGLSLANHVQSIPVTLACDNCNPKPTPQNACNAMPATPSWTIPSILMAAQAGHFNHCMRTCYRAPPRCNHWIGFCTALCMQTMHDTAQPDRLNEFTPNADLHGTRRVYAYKHLQLRHTWEHAVLFPSVPLLWSFA